MKHAENHNSRSSRSSRDSVEHDIKSDASSATQPVRERCGTVWSSIVDTPFETLFISRENALIADPDFDPNDRGALRLCPEFCKNAHRIAQHFRQIIVVSTRTANDVANELVKVLVEKAGGRVDAFYSADISDYVDPRADGCSADPMLILGARRDFPVINLHKTMLLGGSDADRQLAYNCGVHYVDISGWQWQEQDLEDIDVEKRLFRQCLLQTMDVMNRFQNSATRINGLRLAQRCFCHAIATGHHVVVLLSPDSGFEEGSFVKELDAVLPQSDHSYHAIALGVNGDEPLSQRIRAVCRPGDVVMVYSVNTSQRDLVEAVEAARDMGVLTVSVTGAKPGALDGTDVVIKVPSTVISQVQAVFRLVMAATHMAVWEEMLSHRMF